MDTDHTVNMICPYCGHEDRDSWEVNPGELEYDDYEVECDHCGKAFIVSKRCSITYTTKKMKYALDQEKHIEYADWLYHKMKEDGNEH